jgi:hypothetical protein
MQVSSMSASGCWRKPKIARKLIGGALATSVVISLSERNGDLALVEVFAVLLDPWGGNHSGETKIFSGLPKCTYRRVSEK